MKFAIIHWMLYNVKYGYIQKNYYFRTNFTI